MAKKTLEQHSTEELLEIKKSRQSILYIAGGVLLLYAAVMAYFWLSGNWDSQKSMGMVGMIALAGGLSSASASLNGIKAELKKREQEY